ncbi:tumor necrosis factor receptor superfamily member 14 isoform X2 [Pungitius pungitius]|uniref:tumor necrosis factor receptor superfamily member 14 isoform X2 n=1 Tax=Pungitius pungitius TaxID=134920 RepID=UPI002E12CDA4
MKKGCHSIRMFLSLPLGGSQVASVLTLSSTMKPDVFVFTLLFSPYFLSPVCPINCNETQYDWPMDGPQLCCNKCPPGEHMVRRPVITCGIECRPCPGALYIDTYNVEMSCEICQKCDKPHMEYSSLCSTTRNAVCKCKAGYRCIDASCKECEAMPSTTTKPTLPPSTTGDITTQLEPSQPVNGITMVAVAKIKPFLLWIKSKHGYVLAKDPQPASRCSEDEEVSAPIQEVLGKCEV